MSNVYLDDSLLTSIGNSIRGKNGSTDTYTPAEMATAITNLPTSSATLVTKSITVNGTYNASDDSADGYSSVEVNVASSGGSSDPYIVKFVKTANTSTTSGSLAMSITPSVDNSIIAVVVLNNANACTYTATTGETWTYIRNSAYCSAGYCTDVTKGQSITLTLTNRQANYSYTPVNAYLIEIANATSLEYIASTSNSYTANSTYRTIPVTYTSASTSAVANYDTFLGLGWFISNNSSHNSARFQIYSNSTATTSTSYAIRYMTPIATGTNTTIQFLPTIMGQEFEGIDDARVLFSSVGMDYVSTTGSALIGIVH